jgi:predicted exporter
VGRSIRLALWCILAVALGFALPQVNVDADLSRFVSADGPDAQLDLSVALQRGMGGRAVLISLPAATPKAAADASRRMVTALRISGVFATVHNGDTGLLAAEVEPLVAYRYVLSDRVDAALFSEDGLRMRLRDAEAMLADARAWIVTQLLPLDPTLETLHLAEQWGGSARLPMQHGVWFARGGTDAMIIATTRAAGDDAVGQKAVEAAIRQAASAVGAAVEVHRPGLLAAEARDATRARVERLGWVSAAGHVHSLPGISAVAAGRAVAAAGGAGDNGRWRRDRLHIRRNQRAGGRLRVHPRR